MDHNSMLNLISGVADLSNEFHRRWIWWCLLRLVVLRHSFRHCVSGSGGHVPPSWDNPGLAAWPHAENRVLHESHHTELSRCCSHGYRGRNCCPFDRLAIYPSAWALRAGNGTPSGPNSLPLLRSISDSKKKAPHGLVKGKRYGIARQEDGSQQAGIYRR